ncbi:hypothetical protein DFO66_11422 [Brevibacterium sanguinis]|uniref:LPXTG-motif cell wall-anchored protein n=2 Tax=Brevibacterium TaxID=1696 RepID=A0A366IFP6_9MICO|nr:MULTISPECIES: hypothetical protein [Brevibacterium]RBP62515.1 hypothetical protein DFO66_11422 [Brevibacterium sanguinis]RBP69179.1 hypothetical protein DFO65_11422 [Brevibacterium celere]
MKKLALAPAVALAITGLAAAPVFAAEAPTVRTAEATQAQNQTQEPAFDISPTKISLAKYAEEGVLYSGTGLEAGSTYTIVDTPTSGQDVKPYSTEVTVEADGTFALSINSQGNTSDAFLGSYRGEIKDAEGNVVHEATYEIVADETETPDPKVDPKVTLAETELTVAEFTENGITFSGEGFTPNGQAAVGLQSPNTVVAGAQVVADENGNIEGVIKPEEGAELAPGTYPVTAFDSTTETNVEVGEVTLTEEAEETEPPTEDPTETPAAEASLTVSPEKIEAADFVNKDKGVVLSVENCEPGEDVNFVVNPEGNSNVTAYENTVQADDEGKANVSVYGTSTSDPEAYIGDYDVTVTCGDDELTGAFSVTDGANGGGSDDDGNDDNGNGGDDNGNGGAELPRTGAELTGLAAGVTLLIVGGAAVTMTMRRRKATSPTEF